MTKCIGCGIKLQYTDETLPGYTRNEDNKYCERCFKITNYNKHDIKNKYIDDDLLIEKINEYNYATLFLCDIFSLNKKNMDLFNKIKNPKILVVTKMDIIPKNIDLFVLESNIKKLYNVSEIIFFSIKNDFGKRHIMDYIKYYNNVLIVGPTSSGKSSLINHLFNSNITVSNYKNTTQDFITIKDNDYIIIDVPGFNNDYMIDSIKQNGFIKPKTLRLRDGYELIIDKYIISADKDINLTIFIPNDVVIKTLKVKDELNNNLKVNKQEDLIINNIGFIYFKNECNIKINILENIETRESIIGVK